MGTLKALVFDVDGTLADTELAHLAAFNQAFSEEGLDWHWDVALYTRLLEISGGKERMMHYWKEVHPDIKDIDGAGLKDTIDRLHALKTAAYEHAVQSGAVQLRPGVLALIESAPAALAHVLGSPDHASWIILAVTAALSVLAIRAAIRIAASEKSGENR